ncbi:MAG: response regulator [Anaerolineae bacterium]|nr:response regulator [Anaerolineae bacterium]
MNNAPKVLIIDDEKRQRDVLESVLFNQGYELYFAENGPQGLQMAREYLPDVILLDIMMPDMDGFQVCEVIRADDMLKEAPVLFLTALEDKEARIRGLEVGADDFITKPFDITELRTRLRTITRLNRYRSLMKHRSDLEEANRQLLEAYDATIQGWASALELRDHETRGHSLRVVEMTLELARRLGVPQSEMEHYRRGALLHDIGKIGIPDAILHKTGPLNEAEWEITRQHPVWAYEFLSSVEFLKPALDIPYAHHEKWDGSGYPRGLRGEEIPLAARIFAIVDVWDALISDRPYRRALNEETALAFIRQQSGKHFDPEVVRAFLEMQQERKRESFRLARAGISSVANGDVAENYAQGVGTLVR